MYLDDTNYWIRDDDESFPVLIKWSRFNTFFIILLLIAFILFIGQPVYAVDTKFINSVSDKVSEQFNSDGFRTLYTTIDYRPKKYPKIAIPVLENIIDIPVIEVVKSVRVNSIINSELSVKNINILFGNIGCVKEVVEPVLIGEIITRIPNKVFHYRGGMFGEQALINFGLNKLMDFGKGLLAKTGISKEKVRKVVDDFDFEPTKNNRYSYSYPKQLNPMVFAQYTPQLLMAFVALLALQAVLVTGKTNGDGEQHNPIRVAANKLGEIIFPSKPVPPKTTLEKIYDNTINILTSMISFKQPWIYLIFILVMLLNIRRFMPHKETGETDWAKVLEVFNKQTVYFSEAVKSNWSRDQNANDAYKKAVEIESNEKDTVIKELRGELKNSERFQALTEKRLATEQIRLETCGREMVNLETAYINNKCEGNSNPITNSLPDVTTGTTNTETVVAVNRYVPELYMLETSATDGLIKNTARGKGVNKKK